MNKKCTFLSATLVALIFMYGFIIPPTLSVNISGVLNCQNTTVTINATSSAPNSSFSWTGPDNFTSNSPNPVVSVAGVYELIVTDNDNACTNSIQALVIESTPPLLNFQINSVNCFGGSNASLTALVTSNATPIAYLWDNGVMEATNSGLTAGIYFVTVTDNNGCQEVGSATVTEPAAIAISMASTNISCNGAMDGTATAMATGGTGTLTYFWDNGLTTPTISNLSPGIYTVNVSDDNFCGESASITITQPTAMVLNVITTNETANAANDGTALAQISGGDGTYAFLWSNGETSQTIDSLGSDNYCVTVTDGSGCTVQGCGFVDAFGCNSIQVVVNNTNVDCFGNENGTATAAAFNGTEPYDFLWSNGSTTTTVTNLTPGLYTVTCTDANSCTGVSQITISESSQLMLTVINFGNVACNNSDGFASVAAVGGILGYQYLWSNGETTSMITDLTAGSYSVTVTDPNNCTATNDVEIMEISDTQPPTATVNNIDVFLDENGMVTITAEMLNAGSNDNCAIESTSIDISEFTCDDFGSNEIVFTATDVSGLTTTISSFVMVIDSTPPVLICPPNVVMEGCNVGIEYPIPTATDNCAVGTPFFMEGQPSGGVFPAGTTVVKWGVNDSYGNPGTCEFLVTIENDFVGVGDFTPPICAGFSDGTATVEPMNGIPPFTFGWNDPNFQTTQTAVGLSAGEYIATITDATGCPTVTTVEVEQPDLITISAVEILAETNNEMNGAITIETAGGSGSAFQYQWFFNGELFSNEQNITNLDAGIYAVFVTDISDCTNADTFVVDMVTDVFDRQMDKNIHLYPNPTTGVFYLDLSLIAEKVVSVAVFDKLGKVILQKANQWVLEEDWTIDLTGFVSGIYWIKVQVGKEIYWKRVLVI